MNTKLYKRAKDSDIQLHGIDVKVERGEGGIRRITFSDGPAGNEIVVDSASDYVSIEVSVPAPPKLVKKYRLHGLVLGLPVDKIYDDKYEAERKEQDFRDNTSAPAEVNLSIEEVEVPEEA